MLCVGWLVGGTKTKKKKTRTPAAHQVNSCERIERERDISMVLFLVSAYIYGFECGE